jgi:hypothetical protein
MFGGSLLRLQRPDASSINMIQDLAIRIGGVSLAGSTHEKKDVRGGLFWKEVGV